MNNFWCKSAVTPLPHPMAKILMALGKLKACLQNLERVRLSCKVLQRRDLAGFFRSWRGWTICEVINSGRREGQQSACATQARIEAESVYRHQSPSSFSRSFYGNELASPSEFVTDVCDKRQFRAQPVHCMTSAGGRRQKPNQQSDIGRERYPLDGTAENGGANLGVVWTPSRRDN